MEYIYEIRAHHGLCLNFFKGKGYSNEFTENMAEIKKALADNPLVCVTSQADAICSVCPKNTCGACEDENKVFEYDRQVLLRCNISDGEIIPFPDFEKLIHNNILKTGKRREICGDCQWDSLCRNV